MEFCTIKSYLLFFNRGIMWEIPKRTKEEMSNKPEEVSRELEKVIKKLGEELKKGSKGGESEESEA